ncbi:hypothetical protein HAZT_HAZT003041 [Hyalella azteca]|uniref:Uncharacterized protein n=1 Tax=Hyalella azteca TaxID=294128 RepID=A0A6A0HCJ9_HYAAZ|nr:hypothetical protein HAZT_HAZT003041 [Hyalella azteca]
MMSMQQSAAGGPAAMMGGMQGGFSRMSPMASYGGQPGAGAMGQYGAMPMRGPSGVRPAYHRPSSLSPGAQMVPSMSADGKMSQEMYYPAQFSGMGQSQPPRYPNQMMGPSMMRAMTPGQHSLMMSQNGQMMTRPPPPEYRHATNIMQQQQQQMMAQPMPQAMGPGMGQMVYGNMRPGLRPGMAGGNMVNLGNGTPTGAVPSSMLGAGGPTSNASGMVQQQQSLPPSLPSMKPGGAVGTVSSTAPSTSLATSLAMTSMCPASSMACTMTSAGGMSAVHSNVGGQCSVASRAAMMQQHQRSCPPNVNVGPGGLVPQMQSGRPEWSNMMMQRGQTGMMMRPSGYPSHPHHQQQQG